MSMGGGAPATPAPKPEIPVPQEDDFRKDEAMRRRAVDVAKNRDGSSLGHLLSTDTSDPGVTKRTLIATG